MNNIFQTVFLAIPLFIIILLYAIQVCFAVAAYNGFLKVIEFMQRFFFVEKIDHERTPLNSFLLLTVVMLFSVNGSQIFLFQNLPYLTQIMAIKVYYQEIFFKSSVYSFFNIIKFPYYWTVGFTIVGMLIAIFRQNVEQILLSHIQNKQVEIKKDKEEVVDLQGQQNAMMMKLFL